MFLWKIIITIRVAVISKQVKKNYIGICVEVISEQIIYFVPSQYLVLA